MPLNDCLEKIRNFISAPQKQQSKGMFRVTVVPFEDKCSINCGKRFAELLSTNPLFEVNYCNETFPKGFRTYAKTSSSTLIYRDVIFLILSIRATVYWKKNTVMC